jgi:hypothetical protein
MRRRDGFGRHEGQARGETGSLGERILERAKGRKESR